MIRKSLVCLAALIAISGSAPNAFAGGNQSWQRGRRPNAEQPAPVRKASYHHPATALRPVHQVSYTTPPARDAQQFDPFEAPMETTAVVNEPTEPWIEPRTDDTWISPTNDERPVESPALEGPWIQEPPQHEEVAWINPPEEDSGFGIQDSDVRSQDSGFRIQAPNSGLQPSASSLSTPHSRLRTHSGSARFERIVERPAHQPRELWIAQLDDDQLREELETPFGEMPEQEDPVQDFDQMYELEPESPIRDFDDPDQLTDDEMPEDEMFDDDGLDFDESDDEFDDEDLEFLRKPDDEEDDRDLDELLRPRDDDEDEKDEDTADTKARDDRAKAREKERRANEKLCAEELEKLRQSSLAEVLLDISVAGTEGEDYPFECDVHGGQVYPLRCWSAVTYKWKASQLYHRPLYFEEVELERYGHSWGPCLQPIVSGAHFFARLPVLPYCMGYTPPCECMYTLGHYRPGNCSPYFIPAVPISARAGLWQAGAVVGTAAILP